MLACKTSRRLWLAAAAVLPALSAAAEENDASALPLSAGGTFSMTLENDIFGGTDRDYTNGVRFDYLSPRNQLPAAGRWLRDGLSPVIRADDWYMTFGAGQNIYTPTDISRADPPADERPYAGFLYASAGMIADRGDRLDTIALDVGVVGPSSLAEETQSLVHHIVGAQDPKGWDTQLRDQPGVRLFYERKYRHLWTGRLESIEFSTDLLPHINVALGNIDTSAALGATARIGRNLTNDYGPPRVRPGVAGPGFFRESTDLSWYLFAGAEARAVGKNLFLEGNEFESSGGVTPHRLVGDFQAGLAVRYGGVEMTYTHILRSPEYEEQTDWLDFGSLNLRFQF